MYAILAPFSDLLLRSKRKRMQARQDAGVRLGIMRHVFIILDMSQAMTEQDLKPTRHHCVIKVRRGSWPKCEFSFIYSYVGFFLQTIIFKCFIY